MTTHRRTLVAVCFRSSKTAMIAVSAKSPAPRWSATILSVVSLLLILVVGTRSSSASSLVPQDLLEANCIPMFAVSLPVFGPAGLVPRVDLAAHPRLTVTMKEINQAVLPQGGPNLCGIKFRKTRVWAYESSDSRTGEVLGPASWPAVPSIGLCARKDPLVRLTDGKGNVLPGVKIDKIRQMLFYDYVIPGSRIRQ